MSIASNFPAIKPTLLLDFANTEELDPRITFTRASTATYYGTETAKAEENLLTYSQEFDNAGWAKSNASVTANTEVAPDGTTTAETITATASTNFHIVNQTSASTTGTTRTFSLFAKKGTHNFVQLYLNADNNVFANFNLDAGTVGTVGSASTATITNVGNDWYRCVMTTSSATANNVAVIAIISSATAARAESWTTAGTETVFLWGAQLEQRSAVTAYTPTTTQAITNYIPVLETAASGVARFDHNPTTFESLGLLIEESRTNLQVYSSEFDNAAWVKTNATITADTIVAPDGTLTGDKLVEDTATGEHAIGDGFAFTSGTTYTGTIYAKKAERTLCRFGAGNSGVWAAAIIVDLSSGTITSTVSGSGTVTDVGNGWYRISVTGTALATLSTNFAFRLVSTGATISYTGDGYSGIYIWGAQLEVGAFPTSYIPTVASQVTRAADAASMTGTNFSSWYTGGAGTVYSESAVYATNIKTQGVWDLRGGATETSLRSPHSTDPRLRALIGGIFSTVGAGPAITSNVPIKATVAWQGLSGRLQSGSTAVNVTATANLDATQLLIGSLSSVGANSLNGTLKKLAFYPARLTDTQLQALTS